MTLQEKMENAKVSDELFDTLTDEEKAYEDLMAKVSMMILKERQNRGMNQKEFAEFMNASQSIISKWESSSCNFSLKKMVSILRKLDITIEFKSKMEVYKNISKPSYDYLKNQNLFIQNYIREAG